MTNKNSENPLHLILVGLSSSLVAAWRQHFSETDSGVSIIHGNILEVECDVIVSPANSFGFMDGGLDYALSERFGWDLQERLQARIRARPVRELLVGEALIIETGDPQVPWLVSAPTMRVPMKLRQSVNAYLAMKAILTTVQTHTGQPPIRTVAIPGLGTGVGGLSEATAALQMVTAYREIIRGTKDHPTDFGMAQKQHIKLNIGEINLWD